MAGEQQTAQQAAEAAAEAAAQQEGAEGSTKPVVIQTAQQAAEDAARQAAPELSDAQIKRIADEAGKAAARETMEELRKSGALREETETPLAPAVSPQEQQQTVTNQPPPREPSKEEIEIQQEAPRKLSPAEKFIGRK